MRENGGSLTYYEFQLPFKDDAGELVNKSPGISQYFDGFSMDVSLSCCVLQIICSCVDRVKDVLVVLYNVILILLLILIRYVHITAVYLQLIFNCQWNSHLSSSQYLPKLGSQRYERSVCFKQLRVKKRLQMSNECSQLWLRNCFNLSCFAVITMITSLYFRVSVKGSKPLQLQKHSSFKCKLTKSAMQSTDSQLREDKPRH